MDNLIRLAVMTFIRKYLKFHPRSFASLFAASFLSEVKNPVGNLLKDDAGWVR